MSTGLLYRGSFFPFLETELLRAISKSKTADPLEPVVVLVGSNLLAAHLRRELADHLPNGHIGVRFVTFPDLAKAIIRPRHAGLDEKLLSPLELVAAAYFASSETRPAPSDDNYFAPVSSFPGFHRVLARTLSDLDEQCMDKLPLKAGKHPSAFLNRRKMLSLESLRDSVRKITENKITLGGLFRSAAKLSDSYANVFGTHELHIYGFYDMNNAQKELVRALVSSTTVSYYFPVPEASSAAYDHYRPYTGNFERWLGSLGLSIVEKPQQTEPATAKAHPPVTIVSACDQPTEIKEVARQILREARAGSHFDEMMIVLRSESAYASLIRETFSELGIPIYMTSGCSLAETNAGRSLLCITKLGRRDANRASLIEFATECGAAQPLWNLITREAAITQWPGDSARRLFRQKGKGPRQNIGPEWDEQLDRLTKFSSSLAAKIALLPARGTFLAYADWLDKFVGTFITPGITQAGETDTSSAIDGIVKSIRRLHLLQPTVSSNEFFDFLKQAVAASTTRLGVYQRGVTVANIMEARGLHVKHLFVPGMQQGSFPGSVQQDPLLLDRERAAINVYLSNQNVSAPVLPLKGARTFEERLLFELALNTGTRSVTLSFPLTDGVSGKELSKSWFVTELEDSAAEDGRELSLVDAPNSHSLQFEMNDFITETEFHLSSLQNYSTSPTSGDAYFDEVLPGLTDALTSVRSRWIHEALTPYDGCLISNEAIAAVGDILGSKGFSSSRLEDYWSCPFSYLITSLLKARSVDRPEELTEAGPHHLGTAIHETLHQFFKELLDEDLLPLRAELTEQYRTRLLAILESQLALLQQRHPVGHMLLWSIKQDQVRKDLIQLLDYEIEVSLSSLKIPAAFEFEFNDIQFPLPDGNFLPISGKIDRIDIAPGEPGAGDMARPGIRIVDYKSGKLDRVKHSFKMKNPLQLPIYLFAGCHAFGSNINLSQGDFVAISGSGKASTVLDGETWDQTGHELGSILSTIYRGITSGFFPPLPDEPDSCRQWCSNARVCASNRPSPFDSKADGDAIASFIQLKKAK